MRQQFLAGCGKSTCFFYELLLLSSVLLTGFSTLLPSKETSNDISYANFTHSLHFTIFLFSFDSFIWFAFSSREESLDNANVHMNELLREIRDGCAVL